MNFPDGIVNTLSGMYGLPGICDDFAVSSFANPGSNKLSACITMALPVPGLEALGPGYCRVADRHADARGSPPSFGGAVYMLGSAKLELLPAADMFTWFKMSVAAGPRSDT